MREIKISIDAQKKTIILLEYLEAKWSVRVRIKFAKKLYDSLKIIRDNPEIFRNQREIKNSINVLLQNKQLCFIISQANG